MLTTEALKQNEALAGVSDDALKAIALMSENDEKQVVGSLRQSYESSILEVSGIKKEDNEESDGYLKRILTDYKQKSTVTPELQKKYDEAIGTIKTLEEKIKSGSGDEELKKQLKDATDELTATRKQIEDDKAKYATEKAAYEQKYKDAQVQNAFSLATSGLKFKAEYTDGIKKALIAQAFAEMKAFGTIEIQEEDNKIIFRDKDGKIILNPKTNNQPYTMQEVVMTTSIKDALDISKKQPGGGTQGGGAGSGVVEDVDLSDCKTQVEADEAIKKYLQANGYVVTNPEYQKKFSEIRKANNVRDLPIR